MEKRIKITRIRFVGYIDSSIGFSISDYANEEVIPRIYISFAEDKGGVYLNEKKIIWID